MKIIKADETGIKKAAETILNGGLVIYPTETVYGLGCLPSDPDATRRVCEVKQRATKPLPLICSNIENTRKVVNFNTAAEILANKFWPGPLTLVLPSKVSYSIWVTHGKKTLAIRVPDHKIARELARLSGGVIVSTSANISGEEPSRSVNEAEQQIGKKVDLILDGGPSMNQPPSTILDLSGEQLWILRSGPITGKEILKVLRG
jgi:L-threonylcarbamoyladenylate synthase